MLLKEYQKIAVKELLSATIKELSKNIESSIVFKAPTGSGKTIIMQTFLKDLSSIPIKDEFCFIWISVNDLSKQSKISFEKNLEGSNLIFSELKDIKDKILQKNEILFINWEKIRSLSKENGEWKVLAMKDNEKDENLPIYLQNTHDIGRKVILIVDESHKSLDTPKAQELIKNYMKPSLQIEVSATPDSKDYNQKIEVNISDVIKEGMIKKEILVNEKLKEFNSGDLETDKLILDIAIKKQNELLMAYEKENNPPVLSDIPLNKGDLENKVPLIKGGRGDFIKPLLLMQLPSEGKGNQKKDIDINPDKKRRIIETLKNDYDISFENNKLAIWLSEDKTNKELIDINNSPVEVLIFKQAIATGWDCPRAQILVMFRVIKSIVFEIQTVGRILRMPEQKHYSNEILNKAYVYTDYSKAEISIGETAKNLIKNYIGIRNNDLYVNFKLPSFYKKRSDYKDLGFSFYNVLAKTFVNKIGGEFNEFLRIDNLIKLEKYSGFKLDNLEITQNILSDGKILVDIDNHTGEKIIAENEIETHTQEELIKLTFDDFARNQVGPQFTNIARSYTSVIEGLYYTLDYYFFGKLKERLFYQKLILSNKDFFVNLLNETKDLYKPIRENEVIGKKKEAEDNYNWFIPSSQAFSEKSILKDYKKNILSPSYVNKDSDNEILFIEHYLEKSPDIKFWYKNGDNSREFLGIKYFDKYGETKTFYPDFIVYYNSGIIGIFDPKNGFTLEEGLYKAIGLENYILEQNKSGKKIIGGLIEIKNIIGTSNITMLINTIGNYNLENRKDFTSFSDEYIKNYSFEEFEKVSKRYLEEIKNEIIILEKQLIKKNNDLEFFVKQEQNFGDFDYIKRQELQNEIYQIKEKINELNKVF